MNKVIDLQFKKDDIRPSSVYHQQMQSQSSHPVLNLDINNRGGKKSLLEQEREKLKILQYENKMLEKVKEQEMSGMQVSDNRDGVK
jgi:hypothetical protein